MVVTWYLPSRSREIAAALGLPPNTLSFHFDRLRHAGLVTVRREGRSMIYAVRYQTMNALLRYLTDNCCIGTSRRCAPKDRVSARANARREKNRVV